MKIISDSTPLIDGYRMPAEFSSHSGCIIIFPERPDSWQYGGVKAKKAFWLNTEPADKWNHGDSIMGTYSKYMTKIAQTANPAELLGFLEM